ncbi:hypothetical protein ABB07_34145 [Streptomyces incarnatus]|uniref:Arabinogalactan endo-beta-1,4-galactanase n=1 Tax=Streptomyces incarnatus TaxID=665007 RepID=A0ABM5TUX9_9ACTN|nr:hypothetical protein ABB07_34145 [Streptomyces incarnatus]
MFVAETAYPFTLAQDDSLNGRGLGVFSWEATWTAVAGNGWDPTDATSGNGWENQAPCSATTTGRSPP